MPANDTYVGKEQITGLSAVKSLTPPAGSRWAILKSRGQGIYVNLGGVDATSADMLIGVDTPLEVTTSLLKVRLLEAAASATVDVWYFN